MAERQYTLVPKNSNLSSIVIGG